MYTHPVFDICQAQNMRPLIVPNAMLAKAYVPFQELQCLYTPMQGLSRGTIFPELDRPYGADPEYTVDA